jgi:hypothetical protein
MSNQPEQSETKTWKELSVSPWHLINHLGQFRSIGSIFEIPDAGGI